MARPEHLKLLEGASARRDAGTTGRERKHCPLLIKDDDRFRLLGGPYEPPLIKKGLVVDEVRGTVQFGGFTNAPIPWPTVKKTGRASLALCGDLVRALRKESRPAITYHWGVSSATVGTWRRVLGLHGRTDGAERLVRIGVELARLPESRAKISAAARGRKLNDRRKRRLFDGIKKSWARRWRARRAMWRREGKFPPRSPGLAPWLPEEERMLGKRPDQELVEILGRGLFAIRGRRLQLGIRYAFSTHFRVWTPQMDKLLGTRSDQDIATKLGRTVQSVADRRRKLGIRYIRPDSRPWAAAEERWLGRKSDAEVAKILGRTTKAIQHRRLAKGIRCHPS